MPHGAVPYREMRHSIFCSLINLTELSFLTFLSSEGFPSSSTSIGAGVFSVEGAAKRKYSSYQI